MSGDIGLQDDNIIFYSKKMTQAKLVLLAHKGIKLNWKEYDYHTSPSKRIIE
tara:strand:+ start:650 stop:805 length:156 start_codon:yes stop_codon:yes gene_type:complete